MKLSKQKRLAIIFNEWAERYAADPSAFDDILDRNGNAVADYGINCAHYFQKLTRELQAVGMLPRE